MSTHNIGFYEDLTKIIFELSSNTHLISSAVTPTNIAEKIQSKCVKKFNNEIKKISFKKTFCNRLNYTLKGTATLMVREPCCEKTGLQGF